MGKKHWFEDSYSKFLALGMLGYLLFTPWTSQDPAFDNLPYNPLEPLDPQLFPPRDVEAFVLTDVYQGNPFPRPPILLGTPPPRAIDDGPQLDFENEDMLVPDTNGEAQYGAAASQDDCLIVKFSYLLRISINRTRQIA